MSNVGYTNQSVGTMRGAGVPLRPGSHPWGQGAKTAACSGRCRAALSRRRREDEHPTPGTIAGFIRIGTQLSNDPGKNSITFSLQSLLPTTHMPSWRIFT